MYARVATFENPNLSMVDDLIGKVRASAASGADIPDAKGYLMLLDRQSAKSLGITFFDSEEAIQAAEAAFERMADEIPAEQRGQRVSVEVYEVAMQELSEGAKAARVSVLEGSPESLDEGIRYSQENVLPKARELQGWKGYISLADRDSGRFKLITLWDSVDSLQASEEQANQLRKQAAEGGGETILGVERYEVAVAERLSLGAATT